MQMTMPISQRHAPRLSGEWEHKKVKAEEQTRKAEDDKDDEENLLPDGGMLTAQPMKNRLTEWVTDSGAGTELYELMEPMGAENNRKE